MLNSLYLKIERAKIAIRLNDPSLATLINHFPVYLHPTHPTAATNGKVIYFGEAFLESLTIKDTVFVLLHELMHILLKHVTRKGMRDHYRFNFACDIVVNDLLRHHGYTYDNLKPVEGKAYNFFGELESVEVVYDRLKDCESFEVISNHSLWDELSKDEIESIYDAITKWSQGSESILLSSVLPMVDDEYCKLTLDNILTPYLTEDLHDYHYQRVDHRYEDILLPYYSAVDVSLKNLWLVIDVSASMNQQMLNYIFNQLKKLWLRFPQASFQLSFFSLHLTPPIKINTLSQLKEVIKNAQTTGGTDMNAVFDAYDEHFKDGKPVANIIITDGDAEPPHNDLNPNNLTVWVLTKASKFTPEFGKVIHWRGAHAHTDG